MSHLRFTGFDPASDAVHQASMKHPHCEFRVGNILDPSTFPAATYDLTIILGVIHHLQDQSLAIRNAAKLSSRILLIKPNGNNQF